MYKLLNVDNCRYTAANKCDRKSLYNNIVMLRISYDTMTVQLCMVC